MTLDYEYVETNIELDDYYNNEDPEDFNGNGKVYLGICPTATLEKEADKVLVSNGFKPMFDLFKDDIDIDGWYNFFVLMDKDHCLSVMFEPENTEQEVESQYEIPTNYQTRMLIHDKIVRHYGVEKWEKIFGGKNE